MSRQSNRSPRNLPDRLEELSASELIERIEAEEARVAEFDAGRQAGAAALLQAVSARSAAETGEARIAPVPDESRAPDWFDELEGVIHQLAGYALELERRAAEISHREANYAEVAAEMTDSQHELVAQLESIVERLTALTGTRPTELRRAA